MKRTTRWTLVVATSLASLLPSVGFGQDTFDEGLITPPTPPAVRGVSNRSTYFDDPDRIDMDLGNVPATLTVPSTETAETMDEHGPVISPMADCACAEVDGCGPGTMLIATAEATFFWPQLKRDFLAAGTNTSFGASTFNNRGGFVGDSVQANLLGAAPGASVLNVVDTTSSLLGSTNGSLMMAPCLTLGLQGPCWGVVTRYWNGASSANGFVPGVGNGVGIASSDAFRLYTWDLEAQRRIQGELWTLYGFGGLRYGSVQNNRTLAITQFTPDNGLTAGAVANQRFNGIGLTGGLYGTRPLGCCEGPWKLFLSNRYSFLWGNGSATSQASSFITGADSNSLALGRTNTAAGNMFIAELQAGLQWEAQLAYLPGRAFVRSAFEYQYWIANTGVNAQSFTTVSDSVSGAAVGAGSRASDFQFQLVGFSIGAGLMY